MKKLCIDFCNDNKPNAGPKAQLDAIMIATKKADYLFVPFLSKTSCISIKWFQRIIWEIYSIRFLIKLSGITNNILFVNHPFISLVMEYGFPIIVNKKNKVIVLSHDLNYLRGFKFTKSQLIFLKKADCIISHNENYTACLRKIGVKALIIQLGIFDYLINDINKLPERKFILKVSFVGNLTKSKFLANWIRKDRNYSIELIGNCSAEQETEFNNTNKCKYNGAFSPNEVPFKVPGAFGLVWDGDSAETCNGPFGEYLRYNNPHKASLYLASGIPVIIWSQAALAPFIRDNKVGFLIDKLDDINSIINSLTEVDYEILKRNIKPIQERITQGYYLTEALHKAENEIVFRRDGI